MVPDSANNMRIPPTVVRDSVQLLIPLTIAITRTVQNYIIHLLSVFESTYCSVGFPYNLMLIVEDVWADMRGGKEHRSDKEKRIGHAAMY